MAWLHGTTAPKGEKRSTAKRRKRREESAVKKSVRAECVERDGYCRAATLDVGACSGRSEWAHLEDHRRSKTRRMNPELRHTTLGSMMLCTSHHQRYDARTLRLRFLSSFCADGPVEFFTK